MTIVSNFAGNPLALSQSCQASRKTSLLKHDQVKHEKCQVGTVPSAIAPGQSHAVDVLLAFDPALPRSVLIVFRASWLTSNSLSNMAICLVFVPAVEIVKIAGIVNDAFTRLDAADEFRKVWIINFQSVTDERSCTCVDGPVVDERVCPTSASLIVLLVIELVA